MSLGFDTFSDYRERIITFLEVEGIEAVVTDEQIAEYYNRGILFNDLIDLIIEEKEKKSMNNRYIVFFVDAMTFLPIAFDTDYWTQKEKDEYTMKFSDAIPHDEILYFYLVDEKNPKTPDELWDEITDVDFDDNRFWVENE